MRIKIFIIAICIFTLTLITSCVDEPGEPGEINIWSFTDEISKIMGIYEELYPQYSGKFNHTNIPTTDDLYLPALNSALEGGANAPDIYIVEAAFVLKYTKGDMSQYALPYKDLGINIDQALVSADIAEYTVDIGKNTDNEIVALCYHATGGAFIYRRSIAKDVWGSDDPNIIKTKIGPGWDKFFEAAEALKTKGYGIISGCNDLWYAVENEAEKGWVVDGKLYIDPAREKFLDYAKDIIDKGYSNNTKDWTSAWYDDMNDEGPKKIFGYFGPAWFVNYVLAAQGPDTSGDWAICEPPNGFFWGGMWILVNKNSAVKKEAAEIINWLTLDTSNTGLQYLWANRIYSDVSGAKDAVASAAVMAKSNGANDFLGGQNMFDVFIPAGKLANGKIITEFDNTINYFWLGEAKSYAAEEKSRTEALASFKQLVSNNFGITE